MFLSDVSNMRALNTDFMIQRLKTQNKGLVNYPPLKLHKEDTLVSLRKLTHFRNGFPRRLFFPLSCLESQSFNLSQAHSDFDSNQLMTLQHLENTWHVLLFQLYLKMFSGWEIWGLWCRTFHQENSLPFCPCHVCPLTLINRLFPPVFLFRYAICPSYAC